MPLNALDTITIQPRKLGQPLKECFHTVNKNITDWLNEINELDPTISNALSFINTNVKQPLHIDDIQTLRVGLTLTQKTITQIIRILEYYNITDYPMAEDAHTTELLRVILHNKIHDIAKDYDIEIQRFNYTFALHIFDSYFHANQPIKKPYEKEHKTPFRESLSEHQVPITEPIVHDWRVIKDVYPQTTTVIEKWLDTPVKTNDIDTLTHKLNAVGLFVCQYDSVPKPSANIIQHEFETWYKTNRQKNRDFIIHVMYKILQTEPTNQYQMQLNITPITTDHLVNTIMYHINKKDSLITPNEAIYFIKLFEDEHNWISTIVSTMNIDLDNRYTMIPLKNTEPS